MKGLSENIYNKSGVYKITNVVNGKIYIGSSNDLLFRKKHHFGRLKHQNHCNKYLQRAFNKYGEENFKFEVLEYCSESKIFDREQYYLDSYKSYEANVGYNLAKLTKGVWSVNSETKVVQYDLDGNFIAILNSMKSYSDKVSTRAGISACCRNIVNICDGYRWQYYNNGDYKLKLSPIQDNSGRKSRSISAEERKNISERQYLPVAQFDLEGNHIKDWDSLCIAANNLGINRSDICTCCKGKQQTAKGYQWSYLEDKHKIGKYKKHLKGIKVHQYDKDGNYIRSWDRCSDIEKETGMKVQNIYNCLKGKTNSANGYIWKHANC